MRVMAPIPTSPIFRSSAYRTSSGSVIGWVLPSISTTSLPGGVSDCSRNIQRCGMKFWVTPLSGLYSRIFKGLPVPLPGKWHRMAIRRVRPQSGGQVSDKSILALGRAGDSQERWLSAAKVESGKGSIHRRAHATTTSWWNGLGNPREGFRRGGAETRRKTRRTHGRDGRATGSWKSRESQRLKERGDSGGRWPSGRRGGVSGETQSSMPRKNSVVEGDGKPGRMPPQEWGPPRGHPA